MFRFPLDLGYRSSFPMFVDLRQCFPPRAYPRRICRGSSRIERLVLGGVARGGRIIERGPPHSVSRWRPSTVYQRDLATLRPDDTKVADRENGRLPIRVNRHDFIGAAHPHQMMART